MISNVPSIPPSYIREAIARNIEVLKLTERPTEQPASVNYRRDKELDVLVLQVKDDEGKVKFQIPDEARLDLIRTVRQFYDTHPKTPSIIDLTA